ncbi:MAG: WbqC family protein [Candidatus Methylacidiphilales bacterium]|nr:WbqC family protein [Candidatus Methylacidiphilales bacterium]
MIVSINQPAYLPWLGYISRIEKSDLHIVLDHVQFEKNSFTNRNKIRTKENWCWLTVPVQTKGKFGELPINHLGIAGEKNWSRKHWQSISNSYSKARCFKDISGFLEATYQTEWALLHDIMKHMLGEYLSRFRIETPLVYSSQMKAEGAKDELVLNLCLEAGATTYLSGPLGRNYLKEEKFRDAGIKVVYDDFRHPTYPQAYAGFEAGMACLDLLANCGEESRDILMKDQPGVLS